MKDYARSLGRPDLTKLEHSDIERLLEDGPEPPPTNDSVAVYLGRTEVAHYLGLKGIRSLSYITLPPHDAQIGDRKGWLPETIDAWRKTRPGRGRWGARN